MFGDKDVIRLFLNFCASHHNAPLIFFTVSYTFPVLISASHSVDDIVSAAVNYKFFVINVMSSNPAMSECRKKRSILTFSWLSVEVNNVRKMVRNEVIIDFRKYQVPTFIFSGCKVP